MAKKRLDPTTIAVIVVCVVLLISWNFIFGPDGLNWLPETKAKAKIESVTKTNSSSPTKAPVPVSVNNAKPISKRIVVPTTTIKDKNISSPVETQDYSSWDKQYSDIELSSKRSLYSVIINPVKGEISSVILKDFDDKARTEKVTLDKNIATGALSISNRRVDWKLVNVYKPIVDDKEESVIVKRDFTDGSGHDFTLTQTWSLSDSYIINYSFTITNPASEDLKFQDINIWLGGIRPIQYLSGDAARSEAHRIDILLAATDDTETIKASDKSLDNPQIQFEPIKWVAISDKYFACILRNASKDVVFNGGNVNYRYPQYFNEDDGKKTKFFVLSSAARMTKINIAGNGQQTWNLEYYAGPKEVQLLSEFVPYGSFIMHLAFSFLETISVWLLYALIYLKDVVGSYGWAIILLTVIVKLIFWPITHKSNKSMKKMQTIQPLVKELREKYKEDKPEQNKKIMELYKREKVNPLGGCLPIVVQIPVFFALYWTLDGAIELRHSPFLWITDLTQPDTIGHIMGLAINPLPVLMALTMVWQQRLTPMATDPAQAKMMMFMPLIMLFFLYNMPSGLTLYWTVSQLISILQLLINRRPSKKEKQLKTA